MPSEHFYFNVFKLIPLFSCICDDFIRFLITTIFGVRNGCILNTGVVAVLIEKVNFEQTPDREKEQAMKIWELRGNISGNSKFKGTDKEVCLVFLYNDKKVDMTEAE